MKHHRPNRNIVPRIAKIEVADIAVQQSGVAATSGDDPLHCPFEHWLAKIAERDIAPRQTFQQFERVVSRAAADVQEFGRVWRDFRRCFSNQIEHQRRINRRRLACLQV